MINQISDISNKEDFIKFLNNLSLDFDKHNNDWKNITIPEYLQQMASWMEDYSESPANDIAWEEVDFKIFAKILYMGKLYE